MAKEKESPMVAKGIKSKIQSIMASQGIILADLAQRIADQSGNRLLNKNSISARLNGNPSLSNLYEIADALGVKITDLFPSDGDAMQATSPASSDLFSSATDEAPAAATSQQTVSTTAFCPHCGGRVKVGVVLMGE